MTRRGLLFFTAGLALALALGWLGFPHLLYARAEQPLRFSHKTHVSDKTGFACADCHPLGEDGRFAGIPRIDNCAGCHAEPQGDSAEEKRLVEEYVKPGREIPWRVYSRQPENVRFPHAIHVKRGAARLRALPRASRGERHAPGSGDEPHHRLQPAALQDERVRGLPRREPPRAHACLACHK